MSSLSPLVAALPAVALKATLLLGAALAATALMRRTSAAARHLVWLAALAGTLALPLLEAVVPAWRVLPALPTLQVAPAETSVSALPSAEVTTESDNVAPAAPVADARPASTMKTSTMDASSAAASPAPWDAGVVLLLAWLAGSAALLARLLYGVARVRWMERRAREVTDEAWLRLADGLARRLGLGRIVRLLRGPGASVPMTWGTLRPVVLLPPDADGWSDERRAVVLAHELAHVRRWDALTQWVPHLACALLWFHPLVWVAARHLRAEREHACDDAVLEIGTRPVAYADHLLALVRSLDAAQGPVAALAMARRSQFEGRLLAILDSAVRRGGVSRAAALAVTAVTALVVLPLAALRAAEPPAPALAAVDGGRPVAPAATATEMTDAGTADLSGMVAEARAIEDEEARADLLVLVVEKAGLIRREGVRWRGTSAYVQVARAAAELRDPAARGRVLAAVAACEEADREGLLAALDAARGMPADVLGELLDVFADGDRLDDDAVRRAWADAAARLPAAVAAEAGAPDTLPRRHVDVRGAADGEGWSTVMQLREGHLAYDPERPGEGAMEIRGREMTVQTDDRTARILVADRGWATLEERGDVVRRLEIRGDGRRSYTVDGRPRAWDAAAAAWEARYLERLRRHLQRRSESTRAGTPRPAAGTRRWDGADETEGSHHGEPSFSLTLNARGVELAARSPEVVAIRPGGTLSIVHTLHPGYPDADPLRPHGSRTTLTRSLRGTPAADGGIRWRYTVDGAERPFGAEGRAWLERILRGRQL